MTQAKKEAAQSRINKGFPTVETEGFELSAYLFALTHVNPHCCRIYAIYRLFHRDRNCHIIT